MSEKSEQPLRGVDQARNWFWVHVTLGDEECAFDCECPHCRPELYVENIQDLLVRAAERCPDIDARARACIDRINERLALAQRH